MKVKPLLLVAALMLVAMNLWHRWPRAHAPRTAAAAPDPAAMKGLRAEDFRLGWPAAVPARSASGTRNVFTYDTPAPAPRKVEQAVSKALSSPAPAASEPPPKTAERLEEEAARAELAQLRLAAVMLRGGKAVAYLVRGDRTYLVSQGEKVERFVVEAISDDHVRVLDPGTNVGASIPVSGK